MRSLLRNSSWIALLGLAAISAPVEGQETERVEQQQEKSFWQTVQERSRSMLNGAEVAVADAGTKTLHEAKEKYFPILEEAGYQVAEIRLDFTLAPSVELRLVRIVRLNEQKRQALLEKYKNDTKAAGILETVFAAEKVQAEGFEVSELFLMLGFPPHATVVLSPAGDV